MGLEARRTQQRHSSSCAADLSACPGTPGFLDSFPGNRGIEWVKWWTIYIVGKMMGDVLWVKKLAM